MGTKTPIIVALLAIISSCYLISCDKVFDCKDKKYNFKLGVKCFSSKDTIFKGDTLWFELKEPTSLQDIQSGKIIEFSGAENLGSAVSILEFIGRDSFEYAVNKFSFLLKNGTLVNNPLTNKLKEYLFVEENNFYSFKLGVIANERGTFGLVFSNAANVYRKSDKCTKAGFTINFTETNQHYHLNPNYLAGTTLVGGDYYFVVK
jgi:hypothetical protein